ncbi:MAG: helix-turn-helix transcriptional regulator [Coriobacteriia bacterium]|nr:helix-turn-helix transcriptional regulator [Coriobacteriia bacterium]
MAEHIGLTVKKFREERKLSKARLAREAGFSDAYLVQIEKGDRTPSAAVLESLAKALRIPPHRLLIPAGHYAETDLTHAQADAKRIAARIEAARGSTLSEEEQDRLLALSLKYLDFAQAEEAHFADEEVMAALLVDHVRDTDPLALTPEEFWQWDVKGSWAPEHWNSLTERDRKLVQQLINRLVELAP